MKKNNNKLPKCYSKNSIRLFKNRFLRKNKQGEIVETPKELFMRVAKEVAKADTAYTTSKKQIKKTQENFFKVLFNLKFIPQTPTLLNAGKKNKTLSACFVLPLEDSLDSIYQTLADAVQIQWKGGGTGFNFSKIRPKGDMAGKIPGIAAGPIHFIKTFSESLMSIRQAGKRGGGNMAILNVTHPDILDFIHMKEQDKTIRNFNISVGITDKFMNALKNDEEYALVNPRNNRSIKKLKASYVFNEIIELAHRTGDPGIVFLDNIDNDNPTPKVGRIDATNPCGEQPLLAYESCNLGALNLRTHFNYKNKDLDWKELKKTIATAVHFLDNIIDINYYPLEQIEKITKFTNRKMGLGLMGFADLLMLKKIPYNSQEAVKYAQKVMRFIQKESIKASIELAKTRGTFPAFKGSTWEKRKLPVRNATITTIAPNGNTSILGGSTGGIEPAYALVYKIAGLENKNYEATEILLNVNQTFEYLAKKHGFYSKSLLKKLAKGIPVSKVEEIPARFRKIFTTALNIEPIWHLKMQAAFQKYVDNAISKTINFPGSATTEDIRQVFIEAYKNKLKGVTIFRDGCKSAQTYILNEQDKLNIKTKPKEQVRLIIASKDDKKLQEIEGFLKQLPDDFKVIKRPFHLTVKDQIENKISEKALLDSAIRNAKAVSSQTGFITIADKTGFLFKKRGLPKSIANILYFGKDNNYSRELYNKLIKFSSKKGTTAYIVSAIAIYDPFTDQLISTITKIPGKLIETSYKHYQPVFIHQGLRSFTTPPSQKKFKSFHHRYQALQKLFENFSVYIKEAKEINLSPHAYEVLKKRVLKTDKEGNVIESPCDLFMKITQNITNAEKKYHYSKKEIADSKEKIFKALKNMEFQCGGALIWAGMSNEKGQKSIWSKCFVLPIKDSIKSIFDTLNNNIEVLKHGGGTGFNFSNIRSTYAKVATTSEKAAGPVKYLKVYNKAQDTIIGRGGRQMGSMAILNIDHPNIEDFIKVKEKSAELNHYNISVGITDKFMKAVQNKTSWKLCDPYDHKIYKKIPAQKLFNTIVKHAWHCGDPGLIFLDEIDKDNPTPNLGRIDATNPCGEQPLLAYESCNLASINLSKLAADFPYLDNPNFVKKSLKSKIEFINWDKFEHLIQTGVRFLDNVIDINNYPIKKIEKITKQTRSIGLGLMGFADLLIKLGISYSSDDAVKLAQRLMKFFSERSHYESQQLAKKRGNFPAFKGSIWDKKGIKRMRNARCTTIAPTGTISIIANCNPGIEPIFALVYRKKNLLGNSEQNIIEPLFEKIARQRGIYSETLLDRLSQGEKLKDIKSIPQDVIDIFQTSHEITPSQHIKIQAAFQKYCDSGVSKTINLPAFATITDVKRIFKLAYKLNCKGITVFRQGCRQEAQTAKLQKEVKKKQISESPRSRPTVTTGTTTQVKTDQGSLYVTINQDEQGIAEIFLNIGKSGGYSSGYCEAIGRLISVALRAGLGLRTIIDQLKGIRTSTPTLNKGMFVYSVPDAVAKVLETYLNNHEKNISMLKDSTRVEIKSAKEVKAETANTNIAKSHSDNNTEQKNEDTSVSSYSQDNKYDQLLECPECSGSLQYAEGCLLCLSCGYSKCG